MESLILQIFKKQNKTKHEKYTEIFFQIYILEIRNYISFELKLLNKKKIKK